MPMIIKLTFDLFKPSKGCAVDVYLYKNLKICLPLLRTQKSGYNFILNVFDTFLINKAYDQIFFYLYSQKPIYT
jgi:hypothetical protein